MDHKRDEVSSAKLNNKFIVHIGYPKTATTTFQEFVLPRFDHLKKLDGRWDKEGYAHALIYEREIPFRMKKSEYQQQVRQEAKAAADHAPGPEDIFVYSEESLLSMSMFFRFEPAPFVWSPAPVSVARKLRVLFDDGLTTGPVQIIVAIRKQTDLIKSMYAQMYHLVYSKFRETRTFKRFIRYAFKENFSNLVGSALCYKEIIDVYANLFGRENVQILVYEDLKNNIPRFYHSLAESLSVNSSEIKKLFEEKQYNVRSHKDGYKLDERTLWEILGYYQKRFFPRLAVPSRTSKLCHWLMRVRMPSRMCSSVSLSDQEEADIMRRYHDGNRKLAEEYGLSLQEYGYFETDNRLPKGEIVADASQ